MELKNVGFFALVTIMLLAVLIVFQIVQGQGDIIQSQRDLFELQKEILDLLDAGVLK